LERWWSIGALVERWSVGGALERWNIFGALEHFGAVERLWSRVYPKMLAAKLTAFFGKRLT
jgi:hypothetical protein